MKQGFTLTETLLVAGILVVLAAFITTPFNHFRQNQVLRGSVEDVLSAVAKTRTQTLAGLNDSAYGLHFQSDRLVIFTGSVYSSGAVTNEIILLNDSTKLSSINLTGGATEIVFQRLTGSASVSGTITVALVGDASQSKTITISPTGIASAD